MGNVHNVGILLMPARAERLISRHSVHLSMLSSSVQFLSSSLVTKFPVCFCPTMGDILFTTIM